MLTDEQKKYRDRANRARRELLKEKEKFGAISDGSGKRYRVCVYFVLSGAPEKAVEFMDWFEKEFPDDVGEPAFLLYAAWPITGWGLWGKRGDTCWIRC